eukprot:3374070-Rhodomonas_salina.3
MTRVDDRRSTSVQRNSISVVGNDTSPLAILHAIDDEGGRMKPEVRGMEDEGGKTSLATLQICTP